MGKGSKKRLNDKENENVPSDADSDNEEDENSEKPLPKLVLKVNKEKKSKTEGSSTTEEHGHHKKKKKKHKHRSEETDKKGRKREATETGEGEPPPKKIHWRHREKEKRKVYKEPEITPFRLCLENLHRNLQRKDVYNIFSFPVTDLIAPGYSKIIKQPMDFLTMQKKIGQELYSTIEEFREDFVLMCKNAMQYNGPDTIYFKHAEKMLAMGIKMLSKVKLKRLKKALGQHVSDSEDDIVQVDENSDVNIEGESVEESAPSPPKKKTQESKRGKREQRESVTAAILAAAREAREKLLKKHPKQMYGYLSTDDGGNTSLNVLNPDTNEGQKVPVNLSKVAGKLSSGIPSSQISFKEEKKNKVVPVNYLLYGPYGSFGPTHDSSLSNVTQEETDLLLQSYGSELGVLYSKSVLEFTKDASYLQNYVDRLLDAITGNAHSKYKKTVASSSQKKDESDKENGESNKENEGQPQKGEKQVEAPNVDVDINSLMSLDGLGIDVSFLKDIVPQKEKTNDTTEQSVMPKEKLTETASLLNDLKTSQYQRLSTGALPGKGISTKEQEIAHSVTSNLKEMMQFVSPKDVVSSVAVQKAIGVGHDLQISKENPVTISEVVATVQTAVNNQKSNIRF